MKVYKICEGRYLVTDGDSVYETDKPFISEAHTKLEKIKRFILISEKYYKSVQALSALGVKTDYADPEKLEYTVKGDKITVDDKEYKFTVSAKDAGSTVIFIKSGYSKPELAYLYTEFARLGLIVINNPDNVAETSNKWITYELFEKNNIPQPESVLVAADDVSKKDNSGLFKKLKQIYNSPKDGDKYVCKLLRGHGGRGVFICRHKNILSIIQCIFAVKKDMKLIVQKCLDLKGGDIRVNVLTVNGKQKLINAVKRVKGAGKDFRTNLSLGGHAEPVELTKEQEKIAMQAAAASGLVWAGVDIIEDTAGNSYVIEANGAPGTPFDVEEQDELLKKNTEFYMGLVKMIDSLA